MDKSNLPVVSKGLNLLFISSILSISVIVPVLGVLGALAASIVSVYALFTLSGCHPKFKTAIIAAACGLVLNLLSNSPFLGILGTIGAIASFVSTYMVCITIDEINLEFDVPQSPNGALVWKLQLASVGGAILGAFILPLLFIAGLVSIVAAVFYMMLLYKSSKALEAAA